MTWFTLLKALLVALVTFVSTGIPLIVKLRNAIKARREAVTSTEKEKAYNDMLAVVNQFVEVAETTFAGFDAVMKTQGSSAGSVKKENVMAKLQAYALRSGYDFDEDYWSEKVDEIVSLTKRVNVGKK